MEGLLVVKTEYEYNNKTLSKTSHNMGFGSSWTTVNYHTHTFENGRKVKQEFYSSGTLNKTFIFSYDGSGKRTKTTVGQVEYVRSYNTDGTIKDVVYTKNGKNYTITFTWEDGKSTENPDDYLEN
jgi:hypothetical protein